MQEGNVVKIGQPFPNGLLYPRDPMGDAGEVINCRCDILPMEARNDESF